MATPPHKDTPPRPLSPRQLEFSETPPTAAPQLTPSGKVWKCEQCLENGPEPRRRGPNGPATLCNRCGLRYLRVSSIAEASMKPHAATFKTPDANKENVPPVCPGAPIICRARSVTVAIPDEPTTQVRVPLAQLPSSPKRQRKTKKPRSTNGSAFINPINGQSLVVTNCRDQLLRCQSRLDSVSQERLRFLPVVPYFSQGITPCVMRAMAVLFNASLNVNAGKDFEAIATGRDFVNNDYIGPLVPEIALRFDGQLLNWYDPELEQRISTGHILDDKTRIKLDAWIKFSVVTDPDVLYQDPEYRWARRKLYEKYRVVTCCHYRFVQYWAMETLIAQYTLFKTFLSAHIESRIKLDTVAPVSCVRFARLLNLDNELGKMQQYYKHALWASFYMSPACMHCHSNRPLKEISADKAARIKEEMATKYNGYNCDLGREQ